MPADLLTRKTTHFVLWHPKNTTPSPQLVIGEFQPGNPPTLANEKRFALQQSAAFTDLWEIPAANCLLTNGKLYHYWFEILDSRASRNPPSVIRCTDPTALTVDWRLLAPRLPSPYVADDQQPASVIRFSQGKLSPGDPAGETADWQADPPLNTLPSNSHLVIYELPTAWSRSAVGHFGIDEGTFRDVLALVDPNAPGANFSDLAIAQAGRSYLTELGVNALELLPPADSFYKREWGYDTCNFLAPDFDLGFPDGDSSPTAFSDLSTLVRTCHQKGIRFFVDMVMAFGRQDSWQMIDFNSFHISEPQNHPNDPDAWTSTRGYGGKDFRNGFGSELFRYVPASQGYDPISGQSAQVVPARQFMKVQLTRWMTDFRIDGIRMDSVENVANWDFIQEFKDLARQQWNQRWQSQNLGAGADERFLVVGEELSLPMDLLNQKRLDGLWNEKFKQLLRAAILGQVADGEPTFESTVRKAIDCRNLGFADGAQAINYITSHDVEGYRNERLYNFLINNQASDPEKRIKLAFVCLLTAVGLPMILAGEEFADQHTFFDEHGHVTQSGGKQVDPVNFSRLNDPWRQQILSYVTRLVKLRTTHPALSLNDTQFIQVDLNDGKRVLAWARGNSTDPVVVLANFSDYSTPNASNPGAEYVVPNWPATPPGRQWKEITQARTVPANFVGREPIFAWEAKVYALA